MRQFTAEAGNDGILILKSYRGFSMYLGPECPYTLGLLAYADGNVIALNHVFSAAEEKFRETGKRMTVAQLVAEVDRALDREPFEEFRKRLNGRSETIDGLEKGMSIEEDDAEESSPQP